MEKEEKNKLKAKALSISVKEGAAASISANLGDAFAIPFALALKANPMQIGILSSFSQFLYQLTQYTGTRMMEKYSRKKIVLTFVFFQALFWLFTSFVAFLVWKNIFDGISIWLFIILYTGVMAMGGIAYPPWFSWMGDIVPAEKKGSYFAWRARASGIAGIIAMLLASFFLDYFKTRGLILLAFAILFAGAFTFRFISFLLFKKQYSPQFKQKKEDYFSLWAFLKRYDNFGKFAVYHGIFNFAVMVASPFFNVYMLQELNFSYFMFTLSIIAYTIFNIAFLPLAGRFSDKYGNKRLTIVMNLFFILTPILYMLSKNPIFIIILPQLSAGIANAAAIISFTNFNYDAVTPKHRPICVTYTNILSGIGALFGGLIGGIIVNYLHPSGISPYIFVFAVAAVLRLLTALYFLPQIKEVRKVGRLPMKYLPFVNPIHFVQLETIKLIHLPEKLFTKFKSLKSLI